MKNLLDNYTPPEVLWLQWGSFLGGNKMGHISVYLGRTKTSPPNRKEARHDSY